MHSEQCYTHMVLLYPGEQTVESEAGPIGRIITPPETHSDIQLSGRFYAGISDYKNWNISSVI